MDTTARPGSMTPTSELPAAGPAPGAEHTPSAFVDATRPFGAHLRLRWWVPLVLIPLLLVVMFGLQLVLGFVVVMVEVAAFGRDPMDMTISPLLLLATNLSLAVMGPLAVLGTALLGRVPWRSLLAAPQHRDGRRWLTYLGGFSALIVLVTLTASLIAPESVGMRGFAVTGTTLGLLAVALLTTPLQAAGEELMFRGALTPAIASWIRAARPALVIGMVGSSVLFGLAHASIDPWLLSYYTVFGACMAAMALISRGLEAPIAFHVTNNLLMMVVAALFADGGGITIDRSVGVGGPFMLLFIGVDVAAVALVWWNERRLRGRQALTA